MAVVPIINQQLDEIRDAIKGLGTSTNPVLLDETYIALINGTNTSKLFVRWWAQARAQEPQENRYHTLERWFTILSKAWAGKYYTLRGPDYRQNQTGVHALTPMGDLTGKNAAALVTETSEYAEDWADEDPMTWYVRANALSLASGKMNILAVEGVDETFDISGNIAPVYTFRLALWKLHFTDGTYEYKTFSTVHKGSFYPWAGDVDPADNTHRVMNWEATFGGSYTSDGKLTSGAGFGEGWHANGNKTAINVSASTGITKARLWNAYEGIYSDTDLEPIIDLWQLRHFDLENSGILEGCLSYNLDYTIALAEENVTSVLVTTAQGANILMGSYLDVGSAARGGQRARGNVIGLETVTIDGESYCRVTLDAPAFSTQTGDHVATLPWTPGSTEHLPGHKDGSIYHLTNGKTPARIAGVEIIDGAYAVGLDPLWNSDYNESRSPKCIYTVYKCRNSEHQSGSITSNYEAAGTFDSENSNWEYIKHLEIRHDGMIVPDALGASSTTFMKSAFFFDAASGVRAPWRFCILNYGGFGGLAGAGGYGSPSYAYWGERPRLSGSGKKRGEWAA